MMLRNLLLLGMLAFAFTAGAFETQVITFDQVKNLRSMSETEKHLTLKNVKVRYLGTKTVADKRDGGVTLGAVLATIDTLIATGEKIWKIVEKGAPVLKNAQLAPLNVYPKLEGDFVGFHEMEAWSMPKVAAYEVVFENLFGMEVVRFHFNVSFQHGGSYLGKGQYLSGVSMQASDVSVLWGYDLDANSQLVTITNHGTKANPLAGATLSLDYVVKTVLKETRTGLKFHIAGDGKFLQL
jgi:hypothetical protein